MSKRFYTNFETDEYLWKKQEERLLAEYFGEIDLNKKEKGEYE